MASPGFTFKQFHVAHDRCGMKVGTDAVLLGAWTPVDSARRILDIGTGSGVIALMLAQRSHPDTHIDAIEIDANASLQASENILASPWPDKVLVHHVSLQAYQSEPYDLIVSNPPYFGAGQSFSDPARATARHDGALSQHELLQSAARLLAPAGRLALVMPKEEGERCCALAAQYGLHCLQIDRVRSTPSKEVNRLLMLFSRECVGIECNEICIHSASGSYSERYIQLTSAFYLKM